jgi:hypothetical protein
MTTDIPTVNKSHCLEESVENPLDLPTTVHWHGLLVPGEALSE